MASLRLVVEVRSDELLYLAQLLSAVADEVVRGVLEGAGVGARGLYTFHVEKLTEDDDG